MASRRTNADDADNADDNIPELSALSESDRVVAIVRHELRAELFHAPGGSEGYISMPEENGRLLTLPVASRQAKLLVGQRVTRLLERAPSPKTIKKAMEDLEGEAVFGDFALPVAIRYAEHEGLIYVDLADELGRVAVVSPKGWSVTQDQPIRFLRSDRQLALPVPEEGGDLHDVFLFLNVEEPDDRILILAWLVMCLHPRGPYPLLLLNGEKGSAKTTATRVLRALVDPRKAADSSLPSSVRDLSIAAENARLLTFDNLSSIRQETSDALCRLSTGGGFSTRTLYKDRDETYFEGTRPVLANGIPDLAEFPDLLDRVIAIVLVRLTQKHRTEDALWREFRAAQPKLLGAVLTAVCTAMKRLPSVPESGLERMADFCKWAMAAAPTLGFPAEDFMAAYRRNRDSVVFTTAEGSAIVRPLRVLLQQRGREFDGTMTQLHDLLCEYVEPTRRPHGWPKTPNVLGARVRAEAGAIRHQGIDIEFYQTPDKSRTRKVLLALHEGADQESPSSGVVRRPRRRIAKTDAKKKRRQR